MDPIVDWIQANWRDTGLIGAWVAILARLLWLYAGDWCKWLRRWYRSRGSTRFFGLRKRRDDDNDVQFWLEFLGRRIDIHASGKYVDGPDSGQSAQRGDFILYWDASERGPADQGSEDRPNISKADQPHQAVPSDTGDREDEER